MKRQDIKNTQVMGNHLIIYEEINFPKGISLHKNLIKCLFDKLSFIFILISHIFSLFLYICVLKQQQDLFSFNLTN
jgi:hypothetical protein